MHFLPVSTRAEHSIQAPWQMAATGLPGGGGGGGSQSSSAAEQPGIICDQEQDMIQRDSLAMMNDYEPRNFVQCFQGRAISFYHDYKCFHKQYISDYSM